jgi:dipeptide/tripeptide permease
MFDASERGSGFGMARTVYVLLGSVGNVVTGTLAERRGWVVAYGVVVVLMVVGVGLVVGRRVVQPG